MRIAKSEDGSALLEFSLIVPIMALIALAIVDLGLAIVQGMTVEDAARAGAEYGSLAGNATNTTGMRAAAITAANGLAGFTANATTWCSCTPGGSVVSCSSTCTSLTPVRYVQVQTSASMPVLIGWTNITSSFPLSGTAVLRVQ